MRDQPRWNLSGFMTLYNHYRTSDGNGHGKWSTQSRSTGMHNKLIHRNPLRVRFKSLTLTSVFLRIHNIGAAQWVPGLASQR